MRTYMITYVIKYMYIYISIYYIYLHIRNSYFGHYLNNNFSDMKKCHYQQLLISFLNINN